MKRTIVAVGLTFFMGLFIGNAWLPNPAAAEKPPWAGSEKDGRPDQKNVQSQDQQNIHPQGQKNPHAEDQRNIRPQGQKTPHAQDQQKIYSASKKSQKKSHGKYAQEGPAQRESYQGYFNKIDRAPTDRYYAERFHAGKCPPGLAKKGNGCMSPGHARKWTMNKPLPREVVFHDLPAEVAVELGPPPAGYRFVRVAQDILMITVGTGMVVDAIQDIGSQMGQ